MANAIVCLFCAERRDRSRANIYDRYSGSMKITTHLDQVKITWHKLVK